MGKSVSLIRRLTHASFMTSLLTITTKISQSMNVSCKHMDAIFIIFICL
jgi:hypothetical protein